MKKVSIDRARRIAQTKTKSFKTNIIPKGDTLEINSYEQQDREEDGRKVPNDFLLCTHKEKGTTIKLSVSDFNRLIPNEGSELIRSSEAGVDEFPRSITVVGSKDRLNNEDKPYYPIYAYKAADEFYDSLGTENEMAWEDVIASGLKEGNTTDPIQDYTVDTKF